ncbi:recombinase family protein [Mesorhizobium sp. M1365]|uniref:recombinase family protein n=1 Tax=Mesorhizobium sp. M1365 TaxID=2957090 RepID=UPI003338FCB8
MTRSTGVQDLKVALYARYSTDNQRDASIEDQLRLCRLHAETQGWTVVDSYTDRDRRCCVPAFRS